MQSPTRRRLATALFALALYACGNDGDRALFEKMSELAKNGNPEAQYHAGMMLNNGIGVTQDPKQAFIWFEKAAQSGDLLASYKVGCYFGGQFKGVVPTNEEKSFQYKLVAAEAGYSLAQHDVGNAYFRRNEYDEGIKWWGSAAKQGDFMSLYNLSSVYTEGKAVPKDNVRAYAYFKLAKLFSEDRLSVETQRVLDGRKDSMSAAELERAEQIVSQWKPERTPLTIKASGGIEAARSLANTR